MVVRQMKRYFISHAPRFGSYKNPVHWKVEQSPYYFWWLALRNGIKYDGQNPKLMFEGSAGFGEILCSGDTHISFTKWWLEMLPNGERRGEFLFAEPLTKRGTRIVNNIAEAEETLLDNSSVLVRIDLSGQRKFIDLSLDVIIRKNVVFEKGRTVKNPSLSKAKFSISKPVQVEAVKRVFKVYELKEENFGLSNFEVFKKLGVKLEQQAAETVGDYRRRISTLISRDYGTAKRMVKNVFEGKFP